MFRKIDWRDVGERAAKTFLQAFVAVIVTAQVTSISELTSLALLEQAFIAGFAAVLSVAQNVLRR